MQRLIQRLYFGIETLIMAHPASQLGLVAVGILAISLAGGVAVHSVSPEFPHLGQAVWWAFLRLTDPGYLGEDRGLFVRAVSTILTLTGYVLFLGALVAIMTNWLDRLLEFLASGRSPVFEKGHLLIIGWNHRVYALVEELYHSGQYLVETDWRPSFVILCPDFRPELQRELLQKLDPEVRQNSRVLVRSGNPLEAESLDRVDFEHARGIVLLARPNTTPILSDITLAKILMSLKVRFQEHRRVPNLVVDVANPTNKLLAESVGLTGATEALASGEFLGRMFVQAVRQPGISRLHNRFLTDNFGDVVRLVPTEKVALVGRSLRHQSALEPGQVAIGFLPRQGHQADLRLIDFDYEATAEDEVVVIQTTREVVEIPALYPTTSQSEKVLVIGWSNHLRYFLEELGRHPDETFQVTVAVDGCSELDWQKLARLAELYPNLELSLLETVLDDPQSLEKLAPQQFDRAVLFADSRPKDPLVADAETVLRSVLLGRLLERHRAQTAVVVELNDEDNRGLLHPRVHDVFLTQEVVSHLLAQVALRRSLAWIYEELFTAGGAEIRLRSVEGGRLRELQESHFERGHLVLGYERDGAFHLAPDVNSSVPDSARLVVIEKEART